MVMPSARRDLVEVTSAAHGAGLYTDLITPTVGITTPTLDSFAASALDHVQMQISIQDSCQAFAQAGNARATDPVCHLAPRHADIVALAAVQEDAPYDYRRM